ncbi:MAG: hypothetical protein WCS03_00815 [Bacteroidota bacterium]
MVRKIILELKDFDNLYYEVCNEPYFGDTLALREWENQMTAIVVDAEKDFSQKHLISNNVANGFLKVPEPREGVSIYNFHHAKPPVTVAMNYNLNKVVGDNETGFNGIEDATYRTEAWDFIMAGGALFNHLDYSFTTDNEDGSFKIETGQPGGGGKTLRKQFKILADFMQSLNYISMRPVNTEIVRLKGEKKMPIYGLYEEGKVLAMHLCGKDTASAGTLIDINLPTGTYTLTWIDTKSAAETASSLNKHSGGWTTIASPPYIGDVALRVVKLN